MHKSILKLETSTNNNNTGTFRTIFKTQHGRLLYLALKIRDTTCTISDCFYTDRNQGKSGSDRYRARPQKLKTFQFHIDDLLHVIETELDKKFYDVEIIKTDSYSLPLDQYLQEKSKFHKQNTIS